MNIQQKLQEYRELRREIGNFFGTAIYYNITDVSDEKWSESDRNVEYNQRGDEFNYSFRIRGTSRWEKDGYVLFLGINCSGDADLYVFSLENKV